jgi:hypothetical protein
MKVIGSAWSYNQGQRINEGSGYYAYTNGTKETSGKSSVISACVILLCSTSAIRSDVDQPLEQNGRAFNSANSDSMGDTQRLSKQIYSPLKARNFHPTLLRSTFLKVCKHTPR